MALPPGKIPIEILKEVVFKNLGAKRREVTLGPMAGIDGAVVEIGEKSLIVSMDPITGAIERIGWEAVNINANDVSTFGVRPSFYLSCILLPENSDRSTVETIVLQMNKAAKELDIAIIGGHCESTPGLDNPIVVGCAMGIADKGGYITAARAQAGDKLIMTKTAGIEGTAILASDREDMLKTKVDQSLLESARQFFKKISVAKDASIAYETGGVHAMHDPTEGGMVGGIHEIADASNLGFKIREEKIPVARETREICRVFNIDPMYLIASGSMLMAVDNKIANKVARRLKSRDVPASVIGEFSSHPETRLMRRRNGGEENLMRPVCDHLWIALAKS